MGLLRTAGAYTARKAPPAPPPALRPPARPRAPSNPFTQPLPRAPLPRAPQYKGGCSAPAWEAYSKPLGGGSAALVILNHASGGAAANVTVALSALPGLDCGPGARCKVRDVYAHADAGFAAGAFSVADLPAHDSAFVVLSPA